jgi:hypothetical protein
VWKFHITRSVHEALALNDWLSNRNLGRDAATALDGVRHPKVSKPSQLESQSRRRPGRPRRADAPVIPWEAVDRVLVFGEAIQDPETGVEAVRFPSLAVLAQRYGVSRTLLWKYASKARCFERRKEARAKTLARTDAKVIEKLSTSRAAATSDVAAIVDTFISGFRKALDEGKVRVDSAADLDRLVRLRELINGNADSRNEMTGNLTLEALQSRHRQLRGQVDAMTPELAGTTSQVASEHDARQDLGGEERGDDRTH